MLCMTLPDHKRSSLKKLISLNLNFKFEVHFADDSNIISCSCSSRWSLCNRSGTDDLTLLVETIDQLHEKSCIRGSDCDMRTEQGVQLLWGIRLNNATWVRV